MEIDGIWINWNNAAAIAALTGNHRKTVLKWMRTGVVPVPVRRLLHIIYHGDMGSMSGAWKGWKIDKDTGEMYSPDNNRGFTPGHLLKWQYDYQLLSALKIEVKELRSELKELKSIRDASLNNIKATVIPFKPPR